MGLYADRLRRMKVETRSPDRTVILRGSGDGMVELELEAGCLRTHTEATLGNQVRAAARVALAAVGRGQRQARRATAEDLGHDVDAPEWEAAHEGEPDVYTPFGRYLEANNQLAASGTSDDGWVCVRRDDRGEIEVQIRPGALRRTATEQYLAGEIRSAMLAALADHRRKDRELLRRYVGADIEQLIFGDGEFQR